MCTHPGSPFVTGLIVARQDRAGLRTSVSDWAGLVLAESSPDGTSTVAEVERAELPALLAERFGLPGFVLDERDRLVPA